MSGSYRGALIEQYKEVTRGMEINVKMIDQILEEIMRLKDEVNVSMGPGPEIASSLEDIRLSLRDVLVSGAKSSDLDIRRCSLYGLSKICQGNDFPVLAESLRDEDPAVRAWAVEGLGRIGDPSTVNVLIGTLGDSDSFVYYSAVLALRRFPADFIIRPLMDALRSPDSVLRKRVVKLLGSLKDQRCLDALISCFCSQEATLRYEVIEALRQIGDHRATHTLVAALNDEDRDVRTAALKGLQEMGDESAVIPLVKLALGNEEQRPFALDALLNICGPEAVIPIRQALQEIDTEAERIARDLVAMRWRQQPCLPTLSELRNRWALPN